MIAADTAVNTRVARVENVTELTRLGADATEGWVRHINGEHVAVRHYVTTVDGRFVWGEFVGTLADYDLNPYPINAWRTRILDMLTGTGYGKTAASIVVDGGFPDMIGFHVSDDLYVTITDVAAWSPDELGLPEDSTATYLVSVDAFEGDPFGVEHFQIAEQVAAYGVDVEAYQTHTSALAPVLARAVKRARARIDTRRAAAYEQTI